MSRHHISPRRGGVSTLAILTALAAISMSCPAAAQTTVGPVVVTAEPNSAPFEAPSIAPIEAIQPTSEVNRHIIENLIAPSDNYEGIIELTPSVSVVAPNGPGLAEAQFVQVRGFQDGQFNLTLDGVAWGDSNDFTHHTTSYLMTHDLGQVVVDRGPGTASTLGDATFGGTVSLVTKDPSTVQGAELYGSAGSYNTYLGGGEIDTGEIKALNGARALIDVEHLQSDGRLSYEGQDRTNVFAKVIAPVNANTTVTAAAMYNFVHQNISLGSTIPEIQQFGYNYGLNNNPQSQAYYGYNFDHITTDFEYIRIRSELGAGWTVETQPYTYAYYHHGYNGEDPNGETPNGTGFSPNDVPGQYLRNLYRSWGDITRVEKDLGFAVLRTGFWYDYQVNHRTLIETDDSLGVETFDPNSPNVGSKQAGVPGGIDREQRNVLETFQPYFEADIKPLPGLDITPGVKWNYFRRDIQAPVNQGTLTALYYGHTFDKVLPSVTVHYQVNDNWSAYAQFAEGFLAPNLNVLYTTASNLNLDNNLQPQTTFNYQVGGSYHTNRLTLSADYYYINFINEILKVPGPSNVGSIFINAGGTIYKGVEGEADYRIWGPFTVYANGSINNSKDKALGYTIPDAPKSTAALGFAYDQHGLYASLFGKYVGPQYGDVNEYQHIGGYTIADLSLNYTFQVNQELIKKIKVGLLVDNLFDKHGISQLAGYTADLGTPLFWNIVPRNWTVTLAAAF